MTANNLCRIWSELASHPHDPKVMEEARANLTQLLEHVDDCEACRSVSTSMADETREAVFAALSQGGITLADDELEVLRSMDEVLAGDETAIDEGVKYLLAGLPDHLGTFEFGDSSLTSLKIFLSIDAVNLLVRSHASRTPGRFIMLSATGLSIDGTLVSTREAILGEIGRHAGVVATTADRLWTWQLAVAALCPTVYRGLQVSNVVKGRLELTLHPSTSSADLIARWKIATPTLEPSQVWELLGEAVGIARSWRQSVEPMLGTVVHELASSGNRRLQTIFEQITVENREIEDLIKPLKVDATTLGFPWQKIKSTIQTGDWANVVRVVRFAEQQKRSYLQQVAGAGLNDATLEKTIEGLKEFVGRSGKLDRTIKALERCESDLAQGQTTTGRVRRMAAE